MDNFNKRDEQPGTTPGNGSGNPIASGVSGLANEGLSRVKSLGAKSYDKVLHAVDDQKSALAERLDNIAGTIDDACEKVHLPAAPAKIVAKASQFVRDAATAVEAHSTEELIDSTKRAIKAHPGWFIGAGVVVGFLGARLLRR